MSRPSDLHHHLGGPVQAVHRCPVTNRKFENGHGSLSHAEQSRLFQIEAAIVADMPQDGEVCSQTGRTVSNWVSKKVESDEFTNPPSSRNRQRRAVEVDPDRELSRTAAGRLEGATTA